MKWKLLSPVRLCLWPHGLYSPWDSPRQNTGVGSYFLLLGIFPTWDRTQVSLTAGRFLTNWATKKPKNIGVGILSLLQWIFLIQELNQGLLHCRCILYQLRNQGSLDSMLKSGDITLLTKVCIVKAMIFPVVIYGCESWTTKKAECWRTDAFELWCWRRLLRVPWTTRRSSQSIMLKLKFPYVGHLMWRVKSLVKTFSQVKSSKTLMLGKVEGRRRKGWPRMVGWRHWLDRYEFGQAPGNGKGRGSLACCSPWGCKESDMTEWLNKNNYCEFPGGLVVGFCVSLMWPEFNPWPGNWDPRNLERRQKRKEEKKKNKKLWPSLVA